MSTSARLGEFLTPDFDEVKVEPGLSYEMAGVRSFGQGLFDRGPLSGSDTSYSRLYRVHEGQVVLSRLFAFEGALTIVGPEHEGRHLSKEFPTFRIDAGHADPTFVQFLCRWPGLWVELERRAKGAGVRRRRVSADDFLDITVGLPSLADQRAASVRLALAHRAVAVAKEGLTRQSEMVRDLVSSIVHRPDLSDRERRSRGWREVSVGDFLRLDIDAVPVNTGVEYPMAGVYSFGRGLFTKPAVVGGETSYTKYHRLHEDQIVLSRLKGWEGAIARVHEEHHGRHASTEFPTFTIDESLATPVFVENHLASELFWKRLKRGSTGVGARRERVKAEQLLDEPTWLPPIEYQIDVARSIPHLGGVGVSGERREIVDCIMPSLLNREFRHVA